MTSKKFILITLLMVIASFLFIAFIYYLNVENLKNETNTFWQKGDERRGELVVTNSISENRRRETIFTSIGLNKSVTHVVLQIYADEIRFESFYFDRIGLNSFEFRESVISRTKKYSFEEAVKLASKYDIYNNNPDSKNIISNPQANLPPSEIQQNKEKAEREKQNGQQTETRNIDELSTDEIIKDNKDYEIYIKKLTQEKATATEKRKEEIDYEITVFEDFIKSGKEELKKRGVVE